MLTESVALETFLAALTLQAGANTAIVSLGTAFLGAGTGALGTFVLLRKRSLVSDAMSHATLPGLALAFILMAIVTGDGRFLPGLMIGAALTAGLGALAVGWITRRTRLPQDAAIGAVLSVFFGFGVVLMTAIQTMDVGGQAGLQTYLLGSTAGMLRSEAQLIALSALACGIAVFVLRRPFLLVCFDEEYAQVRGLDIVRTERLMMGLMLLMMVIGLKVVGIVLIVALSIIPPVAARFWTHRPEPMVLIAALFGGASGYIGTAISASDEGLPTGAVIVLTAFVIFALSFARGVRRAA